MPSRTAKKNVPVIQRAISVLLIVVLVLTQTVHITPVYGDPEKVKVNLVVLVVDKDIDAVSGLYPGLGLFGSTTLLGRIERYGQDIQNKLDNTRVSILLVDKTDNPHDIANYLEKLYFEGDGSPNEINNLEGVVLIGDVPLPTVSKDHHRYKSLYPYTDFVDKEFLYNPVSSVWEDAQQPADKAPEIWQGLIKPPVGGEDGNKLLALYFDKNHAFYTGTAGYNELDKKVFYGDLSREGQKISPETLSQYQAFVDSWENIAYLRYNKDWGRALYKSVQDQTQNHLQNSNVNFNVGGTSFDSLANKDMFAAVPDILTKTMIDQMLKRFSELFGSYPGQIYDFVNGSGRWDRNSTDTFFQLISDKDEFSMRLIKKANDVLEKKTDEIVNTLQKNITVVTQQTFLEPSFFGPKPHTLANYINGRKGAEVNNAVDCTIYRGSDSNLVYSQSVEANRVYNPVKTEASDGSPNDPNSCDPFGGCCGKNLNINSTSGTISPSPQCEVQKAVQPVYDIRGTLKRSGTLAQTSYLGCLVENFPEKGNNWATMPNSKGSKEISSVIYHKEPTGGTIAAQLQNKFSQFLPIDNPRYVDFQDQSGQYQRVDYVNFFRVSKNQSSTPELAKKSAEDLINAQSIFSDPASEPVQALEQAMSVDTLADALYWHSLNLNDKYRYVFQQYLSAVKTGDTGSYADIYPTKSQGYESAYLQLKGNNDALDFSFLPGSAEDDQQYDTLVAKLGLTQTQQQAKKMEKQAQTDVQTEQAAQELQQDTTCGAWDGVDIWEWFSAIQCWLKEMAPPKVSFSGDEDGDTFDATNSNTNEADTSSTSTSSTSSDTQRLTSLQLTSSLEQLNTLDAQSTVLTVTALDQNGAAYIPSQDAPQTTFTVVQSEPQVQLSDEQVPLVSGQAKTTLQPLKAGKVSVYAKVDNLVSAPLDLVVSDKKLQVSFVASDAQGADEYVSSIAQGNEINLEAEVQDQNQNTVPVNGKVTFTISNKTGKTNPSFGGGPTATFQDGKARVVLDVGQYAGEVTITATSEVNDVPTGSATLTILGGKATAVQLQPQSSAVVVNDTDPVLLQVLDNKDNPSLGDYQVSLFSNDNASIALTDEDPSQEGVQISLQQDSQLVVPVKALKEGNINLKAHVDGIDRDASVTVTSVASAQLVLQPEKNSLTVGSTDFINIKAQVQDLAGQPLAINKDITVQATNDSILLLSNTLHLVNGVGILQARAGTKAGLASLSSANFSVQPFVLSVVPDVPFRLHIVSDKPDLESNGSDTAKVEVQILDQYDNLTSAASEVNLQITDVTSNRGTLDYQQLKAADGKADFQLTATLIPGNVHLIATSPDLQEGVLSISSQIKMRPQQLKNIDFNALYTTLVGFDAGNVTKENYVGGWFLFNKGKTQAVTSLLQPSEVAKEYASVTSSGLNLSSDEPDLNLSSDAVVHQAQPLEISVLEKNTNTALASVYLEPTKNLEKKLISETSEIQQDGIYATEASLTDDFQIKLQNNVFFFSSQDQEVGRLDTEGYFRIPVDSALSLAPHAADGTPGFAFDLYYGTDIVATVIYRLDHLSVKQFDAASTVEAVPLQGPGIYVQQKSSDFQLTSSDQGLSLSRPGEMDTIGETFTSLENANDQEGIGWQGDYKNELLFAAGNSVGESAKHYASSLVVTLGDPVISLPQNNTSGVLGYTQDIGRILASYQNGSIQKVIPIDYNRDGQKDVVVVLNGGRMDILQNYDNGKDFKPMGTLLFFKDGIRSIVVGDVNGDGWEDMIIATSSTGGVAVLQNKGGAFERQDVNLDVKGKITDIKLQDMDHDGKIDLVTSDDSGDIKIWYGTDSGFSDAPYLVDNLGMKVSDVNLNDEPVVYFSGIPSSDSNDPANADKFVTMPYDSTILDSNANANSWTGSTAPYRSFLKLNLVGRLTSEKHVKDLNGGNLQQGDVVEYTITLKNTGDSIADLALGDFLPDFASLDQPSVTCDHCGTSWQVLSQVHELYPLLLGHISLTVNDTATIQYRAKVTSLPTILLEVGNFDDGRDDYSDIYAHDSGNSAVLLYASIGPRQYQKSQVDTTIQPPDSVQNDMQDSDGNGIPDKFENNKDANGIPGIVTDQMKKWTEDKNNDGIPNAYDDYSDSGQSLDDLEAGAKEKINSLVSGSCGGGGGGSGCMSMPLNIAFLAPGYYTINAGPVSIQGSKDEGTPIFGIQPSPSYICIGKACVGDSSTSIFRFYLAPTLTGGVGIAACLGLYGLGINWPSIPITGNCFVTAIPLADMITGGACSQLSASLGQMLNAAHAATTSVTGKAVFQVGYSSNRAAARPSRQVNFDNGTFDVSAIRFKNQRPPSFPDFIMSWVDRQLEEITTKLTDLPTIYLILPDFRGIFGSSSTKSGTARANGGLTSKVKFIGDILDQLNALPFVRIEMQTVPIKYPVISNSQIKQLKVYYQGWIDDAQKEIDQFEQEIRAFPDNSQQKLKFTAAKQIVNRVKSNIRSLQSYADFPKQIQRLSQWKSVLIKQVVDYLNKIADAMGGYYLKNKLRLAKWIELYTLIKEILKGWQIIPNIFKNYRDSCNTCKNDRGNSLTWQIKLYSMLIPELPVIPFPKWPDIVIDVSNINAVVQIKIPDPKFVPSEMLIPKLPSFNIGSINLDLNGKFNIDAIIPKLPDLPNLPDLFPKLPKLPLPKLPDIPPPPKIPQLLGGFKTVLKVIDLALYIYCLYKKGLSLFKEWELKSTIENMTERSGFLPFDFQQISFPTPAIPFVNQIRIDAYVNFHLDVDVLMNVVRDIAKQLNSFQTNLLSAGTTALQNIPTSTPDIKIDMTDPLEVAYMELHQALQEDSGKLLTVDEMRDFLLKQLKATYEVSSNPALSVLRDHLQKAIASTSATGNVPTLAPNSKLVALRSAMTGILEQSQNDERLIGQAVSSGQNLLALDDLKHLFDHSPAMLASVTSSAPTSTVTKVLTNYDPKAFVSVKEQQPQSLSNDVMEPKLLAQTSGDSGGASSSLAPTVNLQGLYIYDSKSKLPELLINYSGGSTQNAALAFADFDNDGNEDVLYSDGGDLYLKRNSQKKEVDSNHFTTAIRSVSLADVIISHASINYIDVSPSATTVNLTWLPDKSSDVIGYELMLRPVINRFDLDHVRNIEETTRLVYLALPGQESSFQELMKPENNLEKYFQILDDNDNPNVVLNLPGGNYYGKLRSLTADPAQDGTWGDIHLLAPQKYGDTQEPLALVAHGNVQQVPLFQTLSLDGSLSYKANGRILKYWWDTDPAKDSDGDGQKNNDPDYFHQITANDNVNASSILPGDMNDPVYVFGPYDQPGEHKLSLNVEDDSGNRANTEVTVQVYVPGITVDKASLSTGTVEGHTEKSTSDQPVAIIRSRNGVLQRIKTPAADQNGKYPTDVQGQYQVNDMNVTKGLLLKDKAGKDIAVISETSGRITLKDPAYAITVLPADSQYHTRLQIVQGSEVLATVELVSDPNRDVIVDQEKYDSTRDPKAVHVVDATANDTVAVAFLPDNAPTFAGGASIYDQQTKKLLAMVGTNGDINLLDASLTLTLQPGQTEDDAVILSVQYNGQSVASIIYPLIGNVILNK